VALRAVTLDAAGTLFDVAEPVGATYERAAAAHGIAVDAAAVERGFRAGLAIAPPLAFPGASPVRLAEHERAWWYTLVRSAFGAAAASPAFDACFADLYAHYARPDAWRVHPEVPDALRALRAQGLRLGIVSNFDGRLPGLVAGLGLASLVDAVTYSTEAGAAKPDPAIFHGALRRLGVAPAEALHAGDDPRVDVQGARAAGLAALLVARGAPKGRPEAIASLDELPRRVASRA
jgi:putative hydrolase of the HAD superfamily